MIAFNVGSVACIFICLQEHRDLKILLEELKKVRVLHEQEQRK